jgi:hypothetical protein
MSGSRTLNELRERSNMVLSLSRIQQRSMPWKHFSKFRTFQWRICGFDKCSKPTKAACHLRGRGHYEVNRSLVTSRNNPGAVQIFISPCPVERESLLTVSFLCSDVRLAGSYYGCAYHRTARYDQGSYQKQTPQPRNPGLWHAIKSVSLLKVFGRMVGFGK